MEPKGLIEQLEKFIPDESSYWNEGYREEIRLKFTQEHIGDDEIDMNLPSKPISSMKVLEPSK